MKILLLNQCFYPDVMATAQQLTSLAVGLHERGHDVTVVTSDRGYDDPSIRFSRRETWQGIEIIRIPSLTFGKKTKIRRVLNFASFLIACSFRLLLLPTYDVVVALTSPPLISFLGALFAKLKRGQFFFWVMDLNPDEAIAAGWLRPGSVTARFLDGVLHYSLRHAERIIVLDRFMKERIEAKGISSARLEVISPWALCDAARYDEPGRLAFRNQHGLSEKFVVMYSGNHSPCHPLDTLLDAAKNLRERKDIAFCFVGGGSEQSKVAAFAKNNELRNVLCLPYQSLNELSGSLSAADLHVAVMGNDFVGIIHPCKVYNIFAVGAPLLYIGPPESSIADLASQLEQQYTVYQAQHGESEKVAAHISTAALRALRNDCHIANRFSESALLPRMIEVLESKPRTSSPKIGEEVTQF